MKMDLSVDLETLVNEELDSLQSLSNKVLKIPIPIMRRYIGSYFFALLCTPLAERDPAIGESREKDRKTMEKHYANFDKLRKSVPHVPDISLQVISIAYGALGALYEPGPEGRFIENNEGKVIASLMSSSRAQGIAKTAFELRPGGNFAAGEDETETQKRLLNAKESLLAEFKRDQSKRLSEAGRLGAQAKNLRPKQLKDWARDKAAAMRGDDKAIARKLFIDLPVHLAEVSKDPARLIYDTLRAKKKLK